jgi:hypothetical protein
VAVASDVAAYDLIAADDEQLSNAGRRYFESQPIGTALMILVTGLHLVGGIPFAATRSRRHLPRIVRCCASSGFRPRRQPEMPRHVSSRVRDLRHSCATLLFTVAVPPATVRSR